MGKRLELCNAVKGPSWKTRVKWWLWRMGAVELPFWEQPEVPVVRGEVLRVILEARRG